MTQTQLPHLLLEQSKDLFWMIDLDFRLIYANKPYLNLMKEMTGVEKKLNESVLVEGFGEGFIEKWKSYYTRAITGEYFQVEEHFYHTQLSEIQYSQVSFAPLRGDDNKLFAVACQSQNNTQILKHRSEADQLMNASLGVFCTINEAGNFVYVSAAAFNHWGYLPEELVGKAYMDFVLEEDVPKTNKIAAFIMSGQEVTSFVNRYKKKNGEVAFNLWSTRWDKSTSLMYGVARDGKEIIEPEEKILQSEERFKALVQEGSDLISILDLEGNYSYVSPTSTSILGFEPHEFMGRTPFEFIHPEDLERTLACLQNIATETKVTVEPFRFQNKAKEWRWIETVLTNMLDNPAVKGIVANSRDITTELKLKELNRLSGRLAKIGSWEVDFVNQSVFWSDEVHHLHETDPKSFVPDLETGIRFYREDFQQLVQTNIAKCFSTGEPFDFEAVLVTANKKEVWVRAIGNAQLEDGTCKRIYGSFQDINSLKETEQRLLSFSENLPGVIYQYFIHPDGTDSIENISGMVKQLWGYTTDEVMKDINLLWEQIRLGGDIEEVRSSILKSIESKSRWTCRFKIVLPTGELKTHIGNGGIPVFLADGRILFNVIILDVTQEAKNEALLSQASEMAKIGSWELSLLDMEDGKMYWSPMVKQTLDVDDAFNPTLKDGLAFYAGPHSDKVQEAVRNLIENGIEFDEEVLVETTKRQKKWVRIIGKGETVNNRRTKIYGSFQDIDDRKKSEIRLAESETRLRTILEAEPECINLLDPGGRLLMMNPAGLTMIGADNEDQVVGKSMLDILLPEHRSAFLMLTKNVFRGKSGMLVFEIEGLKGNRRWLETHAVPLKNEQGHIVSLLGVTRDITERREAEDRIKDSEEKRRLIMSGALDAIICIDTHGTTTFWNPQAEVIFGWTEAEVIGQDLSELIIPEEFRKYHSEGMKRYLNTGEGNALNKLLELRGINRSGEEFPVELTVIPVKQGGEVFFCAFIRDITERKKAAESILQSNERFEKVTEATNDAIWDWDLVNKTYYRSKAIERFFGKEASKTLHETEFWKDKFHSEDLARIQDSIAEAIANPSTTRWESEYRVFNQSGKTLYVIDRGVIVRNNEGKAIRMVGAMTDVSEQKQMTLQLSELNQSLQQHALELERSNEELEQFAFVASHDLQEPLRMISSFMDQLKRKYGDLLDEKGHQYIHFATDGAKRMKQIILDLLEYSRTSRPTEGKETVDLNEVLSAFNLLRRKLISEKNAVIISTDLPILHTYKAAITQILHCLLDNALKYSVEGTPPTVAIEAAENEKEWEFSVKDNGIGIDPQFYDKIFIIFQRLHNKSEYEGTGIGLSVAKRHVEFLGGRIWLKSAKGEGTTFNFVIPKN